MAIQIRRGTNTEWESNKSNIVAGEPAVTTDTGRFFVGTGNGEFIELQKKSNSGDALTEDVKQALLQIASKVAYIDEDGQTYYNDLESALYPPSPLASISAVYTQGGTVYDTDSLDSLKSDLVVTATYEDSSQAVVTTYTLSGTLTTGTSTITVSYGGKTTTFDVTVTHQAGTVTITNTLNGCTNSNSATFATEGDSYSATITASSGYSLTGATVSVTMGNVDITSTAYNNGVISIASLTGNLSITITAVLVELVSISAAYTQSGTVYDTDSLDSLKSDLVVTALYSDATTATVTAYTLSGTLTVGTSTITVSYGGKTATFNVTVTAEPSALYPMENGTHQFTNSSYSKVSISVTDNSSVHYQKTTGDTTGSYVIFDKVSANGESADTSNINAPTATLFTLQQGSSVEFTISNIVYSVVSGAAAQHKKYAIALRSGSTSIVTTGDLSPTDTSKTVTQTIAETKNITCLFVYAGGQITDLSFDVSLVVDGVRWI